MKFAVLDVDGCLLDITHRLHKWDASGNEGRGFYDDAHLDKVIPAGRAVYLGLHLAGLRLVFITGRSRKYKELTKTQILKALPELEGVEFDLLTRSAPYDTFVTNAQGRRVRAYSDAAYKMAMLDRVLSHYKANRHDVVIGIDDNTDVIAAYRRQGIVAYQTTEGWS